MNYFQQVNIHKATTFWTFFSPNRSKYQSSKQPYLAEQSRRWAYVFQSDELQHPIEDHVLMLQHKAASSILPLILWCVYDGFLNKQTKVLPELATSAGHQQLITYGFVSGLTHNKPFRLPSPTPLTWRSIRPLCIAVVMVQDLPGSTQDRLSLQAERFSSLMCCISLWLAQCARLVHPHMHVILMHLVILKNRSGKAININKTICQLYQQATPMGCNEHAEHSETGRSSNHFIYFKLESIKLESMLDIWGHGPLCSDQHQTTTICCPFLACWQKLSVVCTVPLDRGIWNKVSTCKSRHKEAL